MTNVQILVENRTGTQDCSERTREAVFGTEINHTYVGNVFLVTQLDKITTERK